MPALKKSWREKLAEDKGLPRIERVTPDMRHGWGQGRFVIPAPREVDALIRTVKRGRLTTVEHLREALARQQKVKFACPITPGIAVTICARAAAEDEAEGKTRVTLYWRVLRPGGFLNEKYPGGLDDQRCRLIAEGHTVIARGKRRLVESHETKCTMPS